PMPDPHIERARAPVAQMGVLEAKHVAAEFRQFQPLRHLALEHAALAPVVARAATFAGDHQDELGAIALRLAQEREQRRMRLALGFAVKVDAGIDGFGAARRALLEPPIERLEPGRGPCSGRWGARPRTSGGRRFRLARRCRRRPIGRHRRSPQRRDRAREMAPKLALLVTQPSRLALVRAHDRGRHRTPPTCRRNFFPLAPSSLLPACCFDWPSSFLLSAWGWVGSPTGSGMGLRASIMSSSRGSSMTKRPGWRMRPAIRAASSPAPQ